MTEQRVREIIREELAAGCPPWADDKRQGEHMTSYLKVGDKVTYVPTAGPLQRGIVKKVNSFGVFVVYNCAGEWDRYEEYTSCHTHPDRLVPGWRRDAE
jgi:hypothetical protein